MSSKLKHDLRTPHRRPPVTLEQLVAREHTRVAKLEKELQRLRRRIYMAKARYYALVRVAADQARRQLEQQP